MNWPPIETAPLHGVPVLVYDGDFFVAFHSTRHNAWVDQQTGLLVRHKLTHWHQLPDPPPVSQPLPPPPVVKDSLTPAPPMDEELDAIQAEDAYAAARAHAYSCAKAEAEAALAQLSMDDDLNEPLGPACSRDNPECESCQ